MPFPTKLKFWALALAASLMLASHNAAAHHGANGQFDMSSDVEVSGVVTNIRLVNPHSYIYFDETEADGTVNNWRCQLIAGVSLKRRGWTSDMFAPGTKITIKGQPAWSETHGCHTQTITFEDGTILHRDADPDVNAPANSEPMATPRVLRVKGKPNLSGFWIIDEPERPARPERPGRGAGGPPMGDAPMGAAMGAAMGNGAMGQNQELPPSNRYDMTEANIQVSAGFMRNDNPRFHCKATNIIRDWAFGQNGQNVSAIEQADDIITLRYGFMDITRTIHMDMVAHPKDITSSRAGHSIGRWDGDVLVVDTIGFEEGYLDAGPASVAMHSDQLHVVERFRMSEDGQSIRRDYELNDALYLNSKAAGSDIVRYTNTAYVPYDCVELTNERIGAPVIAASPERVSVPAATASKAAGSNLSQLWLIGLAILAAIGGLVLYARKKS